MMFSFRFFTVDTFQMSRERFLIFFLTLFGGYYEGRI